MANLYKYMSADIADVLLINDNQFSIKFTHLHEYNDPYEFFLTIDYQRPAQELAFYNEMIGMVFQQALSRLRRQVSKCGVVEYLGNQKIKLFSL